MRGQVKSQPQMFYRLSLEEKVPQNHPLRRLKELVDGILGEMDSFFSTLYSDYGAPSIPPEQLLKALLLQILFSIRSERQDDKPDDTNGFASRNPEVDFKGHKRTNETHQSTTDPEARLFKKGKGKETKLCFMGHVLMENRHGLAVSVRLTQATGTAEREAAFEMVDEVKSPSQRITLGGDKGFDVADDIEKWRKKNVTPHFARKETSRLDERTTRHNGYEVSQRKRRRIEEHFGWDKTVGGMRKVRHIGKRLVGWMFTFTTAAYNLIRINNILRQQAA
jgi:hypothetical protein